MCGWGSGQIGTAPNSELEQVRSFIITRMPLDLRMRLLNLIYIIFKKIAIHVGHVRSESQSVQYVPFDIWTSCTPYKHIKIKVHSFKYGTSVREKINCKIIDKYLRFEYTL